MNKSGPIFIIDDDTDDHELLQEIFAKLEVKNTIRTFSNAMDALSYLEKTEEEPFLIFCDINMPGISGVTLKELISKDRRLAILCIPFLFFSTSSTASHVVEAYMTGAQGYFIKPSNLNYLESMIKNIIDYWMMCVTPKDLMG